MGLRYGFKKVQALQDHFGVEGDGADEDEGDWGIEEEEEQMRQVEVCEEGFMNVHLEQVQDIGLN